MKKIIPNIILLSTLAVSKAEQITLPSADIIQERLINNSFIPKHMKSFTNPLVPFDRYTQLSAQLANQTLDDSVIKVICDRAAGEYMAHLDSKNIPYYHFTSLSKNLFDIVVGNAANTTSHTLDQNQTTQHQTPTLYFTTPAKHAIETITLPTEKELARRIETFLLLRDFNFHTNLASQLANKELAVSTIETLCQKAAANFAEHLTQKISDILTLSETLQPIIEMIDLQEKETWDATIQTYGGNTAYELAQATGLYQKLISRNPSQSTSFICKNAIDEYQSILVANQASFAEESQTIWQRVLGIFEETQVLDQNEQVVPNSELPLHLMHSGMMQ